MDADKVAAVAAWPTPHSPRALRGFLGLAGYYRKFIREFGIIASPLTRLLRSDAFAWDAEATEAFEALKGALMTEAVYHAAEWISKLFGFDFTVEYRPGCLNTVADALSRRDADHDAAVDDSDGAALCIHLGPSFALFADIRRATADTLDAQLLRQRLHAGDLEEPWRLGDGLLLHRRLLFVPDHGDLRHQVLLLAHSAGHEGVQKTLHRLRADFYIPGDRAQV
ncbi:uncharacterized protein [Aegilops tauschii subsp. strangulata]|uniref:uncharacterized protein n=1 Tax=Aegilops tauschii subsp. strangulata TaxID=200361 RepID=UPI003CC84700